jgi:cyclohexyl-isocyanide hydratase
MAQATRKSVGIVLYQDCTLLDFCGATQIFADYASQGWTPKWLSDTMDPVKTSEGMSVLPQATFDALDDMDILFVPGGGGAGVRAAMENPAYLTLLQDAAAADKWIGSVCVGTFILAAAGVLNGTTCTTHWLALEQLRRLDTACAITVPPGYPRDVIDSANKRFTGGGVSSSIDLALTLLRDLGSLSQANHSALLNQYAPSLPEGVLPGAPDQADPATIASIEDDPKIRQNFLAPIAAGVDRIIAAAAAG